MTDYDEAIFSPETTQQQIVLARRQLDNEVVVFRQNMQREQEAVDEAKRQLVAAKMRVEEQEAVNWRETNAIRTRQADVETQQAVIKREKGMLAAREKQVQVLEDQRRRNRTVSEAFIEDSFAALSARAVVENLTNSSSRIRNHAMKNISVCIGDIQDSSLPFVRFTPQDIAPDLLPKLHILVSPSNTSIAAVVRFAEESVSAPPMAKALALAGQCTRLAEYLIETNESVSRLAICCLRQMVRMETSVVQPAYEAMAVAIPQIPGSSQQSQHPSIDFVKEVAPKIIADCFDNGLWSAVAPLVKHHIPAIQVIVLRRVVVLATQSERNQQGIIEGHILGILDPYYQSSSPPSHVVEFFVELLPLVAERLCRRSLFIEWLLKRLSDPNPKINATCVDAFRKCMANDDPTVFQLFVKVDLLEKLGKPPITQSNAIIRLISQLLPVLAIPYAKAKAAERIVRFLDHSDPAIATACLSACVRIVDSTLEDRTHLFSVVSQLSFTRESTLKLYDRAMPAFCKDWAASGDLKLIVQHMRHSEQRIRRPAQQVWHNIVFNSTTARSKIVHDGLLEVVFDLCGSRYDDAVLLGATCCSQMAIEITKAGVPPTQKLVALLNHPNVLLRQAALRGIQFATESSDANCKVILEAEGFKALQLFFETYPKDLLQENAHKILTRLAPFLLTSPEACAGLLQLLESTSPTVQHAARNALLTISSTNRGNRETLRGLVLNRLELPTEPLIDYAVKAIQDWIGPDLAHLNDFPTFFGLLEHSDKRIQTAALISLKQKLPNSEYEDSLEKANIIHTLRSLSNSDNPEALSFVTVALRALALSLAKNGHASNIINLLVHKEPKVRDGAAAALEAISSGSPRDRKLLLEEDIIERLVGHEEHLEQTQIQVLSSIVPLLALDYLDAGKVEVIFRLVDHPQQQIRTAASKAIAIVASGSIQQKTSLRDALLPKLDQASPLLREVAATCLSRSLARDLVVDGDFTRIFRIMRSGDARVREPVIAELHAYIQESDESGRRRLVDARILPEILQAYTPAKDDLLDFMSGCLLPLLGPAFTQDNGGATLFPLLTHNEHRLRVSAIQALRNAIDSRYGNKENMAKAAVVGTLHPLIASDDLIRDLWCRILPQVAPYLTNRAEIDTLFESLDDDRGNVREAASEAISVLARASETSRSFMLPSLLHNLEDPSPVSIPSLAQAISLSGSAFVSHGKEAELLYLILNGKDVEIAAVEATIQLLSKGSSFEHQQLMKADPDVLTVALILHDRQSLRQHSLKLLHNIVTHLSYTILLHEELAREMFSLFDDPDPGLSNALYQTWSGDPRVSKIETLPELLPLLFDDEKLRNPSVVALLQELAPTMVPQLLSRRKLDILVKALTTGDVNVVQSFLQETCYVIENSNENEKGWFVAQPSFVSTIGEHLRGHDPAIRRDSSTIIRLLSTGSASRSGKIMNEGIGRYLSWIAVNGEKGAQQSSLRALYTLFMAAPDHAEPLVEDSLPALCDILEREDLFLGVYTSALRLLTEIVKQSPHSSIIESGIVVYLVRWSSFQFSVTDTACKKDVFLICQLIAQQSDAGRQALIDSGILPELSSLTRSQLVLEVVSACKILKSLAHTGTFRQNIISAGLETSLKHITSLFRKSTLQDKEEKQLAQTAAKEVLETLKKTSRRQSVESLVQPQALQRRTHSETMYSDQRPPRKLQRRTASDSATIPGFDSTDFDDQYEEEQSPPRRLGHSQSFSEPALPRSPVARRLNNSRSFNEPDRTAVRPQLGRLSAVREDPDHIPDLPRRNVSNALVEEEEPDYVQPIPTASGLRTSRHQSSLNNFPAPTRMASSSALQVPLDDDHLTEVSSAVRTSPPSYRPVASVAGSVRRPMGRTYAQNVPSAVTEESDLDREMASTSSSVAGTRRSYRRMPASEGGKSSSKY